MASKLDQEARMTIYSLPGLRLVAARRIECAVRPADAGFIQNWRKTTCLSKARRPKAI